MSCNLLRKHRYNLLESLSSLEEDIGTRRRILFVAPHLSTGGMPQYLLRKIETLNEHSEVYCLLYSDVARIYDVQKKKISNLLGDRFIILDNDESLIDVIKLRVFPDIVHFEDIPERFVSFDELKEIYSINRPYFICETPHSSTTDPEEKVFLPDMFVMVNEWMVKKYKNLGIPSKVLEYYLPEVDNYSKDEFRDKVGFLPSKKNIINVGLFTPGKNQGDAIEYARSMLGYPVEFHFLGNRASNFISYWKPLMDDLPSNCKIWGEVDNVSDFYKGSDLFLFTSRWELSPIVIKESISHRLPILMNKLPSYLDEYDDSKYVHYLTESRYHNEEKIKKILGI